jgi:hypothetical protein
VGGLMDYEVKCTPYARQVLREMQEMLDDIRAEHPEMNDEEWKQWVMEQIEWKGM